MSETNIGTISSKDLEHNSTQPAPHPVATRRIPPPPPAAQRVAALDTEPRPSETPSVMVIVRPWIDPLVDEIGHDPRSRYVEQFWLGVLGPTATWLVRRLADGLSTHPDGYSLDLSATARAMGLSYTAGRSSPFSKALQRCTMFGLAHQTSDGIAIRRRIPTVAHRHLRRMPPEVQTAHTEWHQRAPTADGFTRAHHLAIAMLETGDDLDAIEHQLVAIGVDQPTAAEVAENAAAL